MFKIIYIYMNVCLSEIFKQTPPPCCQRVCPRRHSRHHGILLITVASSHSFAIPYEYRCHLLSHRTLALPGLCRVSCRIDTYFVQYCTLGRMGLSLYSRCDVQFLYINSSAKCSQQEPGRSCSSIHLKESGYIWIGLSVYRTLCVG